MSKLLIYRDQAVIKIEPNFTLRGCVFPCEERELCQKAQDEFFKYVRIKTLSYADIPVILQNATFERREIPLARPL